MSVSRHHADWLSLVESSGPFLSLPVLLRAFPQGLDPRDPEQAKELRLAYEEWQENPTLTAKQRAWVMHVLTQVLLHPRELLAEGQTLPPGLTATMAEYGEILRPELALIGPTGSELAGKPQLLICLYPVEQSLDKPVAGKHWKATPGTRMMELLHATDVPLGLVTNGEEWMLVFAPRGDTTGFTSWYASLWIDEPITLRAFHSLLSTRRFFGVAPSDTLLALLKESAQDQQEVTNQLGDQVRDAVEVLIQAFDRLDQDSGRTLLKGLDERSLYDAALTVMMRLVFLFSAEERGLLHLGEPLYNENYAVSTLREQLQEVADHYGEEVLERRHDGWARLLAIFRAVHGGVNHQDLMLPAYGGSLFDPDRYPFLEGRAQGSRWQSSPAAPLEINNRVVLHLLKSLQMLQVKVPGGGPAEALRVSFEGLNIEQIGLVYEGLLDHTAVRAKEVVLGLAASRKKPVASIALAELEKLRRDDKEKLIEVLEEETGRSARALENALKNGAEPQDFHKLLIACGQDKELADRIIPFRGLLRQDSFERLVVVLPGGVYVGQSSARRSTGTHYTPRSLTEPIVQHTLEPLVYLGPAEGLPKEQWRLRSPKEILDLKVCDMAMGSGAFLVQTCRYLSERLVEAWESLELEHPGEVLITPEGEFSQGEPSERLIPKEAAERLAIARRLVADRCLYGVDINPMAVEMAKLSIWLITVDKSRPFTFLDHAFKCGDSLLGICRFKQLESFSFNDEQTKQAMILSNYDELIRIAIAKRRELETLPSSDTGQIAAKTVLLAEAEERLAKLKLTADLLLTAELIEGSSPKKEASRVGAHIKVTEYANESVVAFKSFVLGQLDGLLPFHWPLEFPEIISFGGFDAILGNPPFLGGLRVSEILGVRYNKALVEFNDGATRKVDICCYFFRRASDIVRRNGQVGLIATNSLTQGLNRRVSLDYLLNRGFSIVAASPSIKWPGTGAVEVSVIHIVHGPWHGEKILAQKQVKIITSSLSAESELVPVPLIQNSGKAYVGPFVYGDGFLLTEAQAKSMRDEDAKNAQVILPYLVGQDINSSPQQQASRYVISFEERSEDEARQFVRPFEHLKTHAFPFRNAKNPPKRDLRLKTQWWKFFHPRLELISAMKECSEVCVRSQVSTHHAVAVVPSGIIPSHFVVVFLGSPMLVFGVVQSCFHEEWVWLTASSLGGLSNTRYIQRDCFLTFPFPDKFWSAAEHDFQHLRATAAGYYDFRQQLMLARQEGLTKLYNRFHDPGEKSADIERLRALHLKMDQAVAAVYGWLDLDLDHGFHETKQGVRYALSDAARENLLDRLLALNHQRHAAEVRADLSGENTATASSKRAPRKSHAVDKSAQGGLY
jgi:hypothetical protein